MYTEEWQICCQWKESSTFWEQLPNLKESHPVQTDEFAVAQGINHKPAFNSLVKHVIKKRENSCQCYEMANLISEEVK